MKRTLVAAWVVGICMMGWGVEAMAQQAEAQFRVLLEVYIAPGTAEEFEAASKDRTASMVAGNVDFGRLASVSEDGVYRFMTQLGEEFSSVAEWREQLAGMPSVTVSPVGIIDHVDRSIWRSRPDLSLAQWSTVPLNSPRIDGAEIGFLHEIRFYPKFGRAPEVADILRRITALAVSRDLNGRRLVAELVVGPEAPAFRLVFLARDPEDYYAQRARDRETMGEEFQELVNQVLRLCRNVEQENYTRRRDLDYQPSN